MLKEIKDDAVFCYKKTYRSYDAAVVVEVWGEEEGNGALQRLWSIFLLIRVLSSFIQFNKFSLSHQNGRMDIFIGTREERKEKSSLL